MASFVKYYNFVQDLGRKVHNLNADTMKVALTNSAPNVSTHTVRADITELSGGNGYSSGGGTVANSSYAQTSGTGKFAGDDVTFTASGGDVGPFRYAVMYNDTPTSPADPLIGYWDYGSAITLHDVGGGDSFTVNVSDNTAVLSIT